MKLLLGIYLVYPFFETLRLSFMDATGEGFVGLSNYAWVLTDENFLITIRNNFLWLLVVPAASTALGLIVAVLGSIYTGFATATEAAGLGVVGALLISWVQGSLTRATFTESLLGATRLSCMIALILSGAAFLTLAMGFTGLPRHLADWI
ncbi:TRAP transporter large permease subunit, partial [Vreelandella neptunia]|uniref:TRAP transporter large permease subunit n=1 Tax=Vreelandella neptunia TaxID=115551 RepID=UPI0030EB519E